MPMKTLTRLGVVVDRSFVEQLSEIIRPFSIGELREMARAYRDSSDDLIASSAERAEITAGIGGVVYCGPGGSVTDSNGLTWEFPVGTDIPWDLFDDVQRADFSLQSGHTGRVKARVSSTPHRTSVTLTAPVEQIEIALPKLEALMDESVSEERAGALMPPFRVFIGHGGDRQWEAVRRIVETQYEVAAFETHDRLGQQAFEVVENMISEASVAVIVMTATDERADGRKTARQNVVHELGFAQGRLGARNTIIVVEGGTELFSNIESIQQVRFAPGEIHTVEDAVLAALANRKREIEERMRGSA